MSSNEQETRYSDIQRVIQNVLDRDGQHDWDETARLTDVIAPAVWNEIHTFPLAAERSAGAAPPDAPSPEGIAARVGSAASGAALLDMLREAFSDFDPCHECDNAEKAWAALARPSPKVGE